MLGAQAVAKAFPEYPTNIVKVHDPCTHLRDNISMAGPEVMAVAKTASAQKTFQVGQWWAWVCGPAPVKCALHPVNL